MQDKYLNLSGDQNLLQESVVILLKGMQLAFLLGFGTQLSVFDHFWIEVTIYKRKIRIINRKCFPLHLNRDKQAGNKHHPVLLYLAKVVRKL